MKKTSLMTKILVALVAGVVLGMILYPMRELPFVKTYVVGFFFNLLGDGFIRAIRMVVVPLVFCSITVGAAGMEDVAKLGRIGIKIVCLYLFTTAVAIILALVIANLTNPGLGLNASELTATTVTVGQNVPFLQTLLNIIPINPAEAMAKGEILAIILFALVFGISMALVGEKANKVREILMECNTIMLKLVEIVMILAPYGVF